MECSYRTSRGISGAVRVRSLPNNYTNRRKGTRRGFGCLVNSSTKKRNLRPCFSCSRQSGRLKYAARVLQSHCPRHNPPFQPRPRPRPSSLPPSPPALAPKMTEPSGPYSRPSSSAAVYAAQASMPPPSPRPSVASRGSRSSLRRQAAIAAGSASASASPPQQIQHQQQPTVPQTPAELPNPKLGPLFTTITSTIHPSNKSTTHYPTLHYIFADDDPDILTEALARHHRTADADEEPDDERPGADQPPSERAIVVDLALAPSAPAGYEVVWSSSLTPDWAVVDARVNRMDGTAGSLQQSGGSRTLMLQIDGVSVESSGPQTTTAPSSGAKAVTAPAEGDSSVGSHGGSSTKHQTQQPHQQPTDEYPALVEEFEKRMGVLKRVVQAAEVRRRTMDAAEADDGAEEELTQRPSEEEVMQQQAKGNERAQSVEEEDDE